MASAYPGCHNTLVQEHIMPLGGLKNTGDLKITMRRGYFSHLAAGTFTGALEPCACIDILEPCVKVLLKGHEMTGVERMRML